MRETHGGGEGARHEKAFAYALSKTEKFKPVEENRMMRIVHTDAEKDAEELADMVEKRWGYRPEDLPSRARSSGRTSGRVLFP